VSIGNSLQTYISLAGPREVYAGSSASKQSPVTELSARTFGAWTAISAIVRLYAAYNIRDPAIYQMAMWTFGIAFAHFGSEWLVFGTVRMNRAAVFPISIATGTGAWMLMQWGSYVG